MQAKMISFSSFSLVLSPPRTASIFGGKKAPPFPLARGVQAWLNINAAIYTIAAAVLNLEEEEVSPAFSHCALSLSTFSLRSSHLKEEEKIY